jgi:hypothetical protein
LPTVIPRLVLINGIEFLQVVFNTKILLIDRRLPYDRIEEKSGGRHPSARFHGVIPGRKNYCISLPVLSDDKQQAVNRTGTCRNPFLQMQECRTNGWKSRDWSISKLCGVEPRDTVD